MRRAASGNPCCNNNSPNNSSNNNKLMSRRRNALTVPWPKAFARCHVFSFSCSPSPHPFTLFPVAFCRTPLSLRDQQHTKNFTSVVAGVAQATSLWLFTLLSNCVALSIDVSLMCCPWPLCQVYIIVCTLHEQHSLRGTPKNLTAFQNVSSFSDRERTSFTLAAPISLCRFHDEILSTRVRVPKCLTNN